MAGVLALGLAGPALTSARASSVTIPASPGDDVTWRRLAFRASKLLVTANAEVVLTWRQAPTVLSELEEAATIEALYPSGERVIELAVTSSLLGRDSTTWIWLDPDDLAVLQSRQIDQGKRERFKVYRYGRAGVYSRRVRPQKQERGQALESWTDVQEETAPIETTATVSDPSALFFWLSSIDPKSLGDGQTLTIYSKSLLNPVRVTYAGAEEVKVDYLLHGESDAEGNAVEISGRIPAYRYALRPGGGDEDDLELLGLEGDLELYVDAIRRVPIRLEGRVSPVGKVTANLKEAWLAPSPPG